MEDGTGTPSVGRVRLSATQGHQTYFSVAVEGTKGRPVLFLSTGVCGVR
jgi:hypothetical protein